MGFHGFQRLIYLDSGAELHRHVLLGKLSDMRAISTVVGPGGEIVIPSEIRDDLDIHPGTRIAVSREGNRIILEPINNEYVRSLRGCLAGGPSMADELLKDRREEDAKSKW